MDDKSIALDAVNKEAVDLENASLEEVFQHLKCTREGLSFDAVQERLELFGYNKLEEKKESKILKFLGFMWNPLSWVMEAAAIMAIALAHGGHKGVDYHDFVGIVILLIIDSTISFIEENNAGNAAAALMARLAPKAKVLRDGKWSEEDASVLVPGDIVSIKLGDIIPADARLLEGDPLKIDQDSQMQNLKHVGGGFGVLGTQEMQLVFQQPYTMLGSDIRSKMQPNMLQGFDIHNTMQLNMPQGFDMSNTFQPSIVHVFYTNLLGMNDSNADI